MLVRCWSPVICLLLCALGAYAQTATLLKDINTTVAASFSSEPNGLVDLNGIGYFFASSTPGVQGLWRTDGTAAGTQLLKDHLDGRHLTASAGKLFFVANDRIHGSELWTSDGTSAGTLLVKDIGDGFADGVSPNRGILAVDGTVFFVAGDFAGLTLWKSDGTEAGSTPLLAVDPDLPSSIDLLGALDGMAYFYANDGVNGSEFWRSDGTPAGTVMVRDIRPGPESSFMRGIVVHDGSLFFTADDGVHGYELWKSDGTMMGTSLVVDLNPGEDGAFVNEYLSRIAAGDELYFAADNGDGSGIGLWKSDGTGAGTERLLAGVESQDLTDVGNLVYFIVVDGFEAPSALWKTDGTTAGTALIREFVEISSAPTSFGGSVYFAAADDEHGAQLWKSNGSPAGTVLVKQINASRSAYPGDFVVLRANPLVSGTLVFRADDGVHGSELWKTSGSESGTVLIKDIGIEAGNSYPGEFLSQGGELYFTASAASDGRTQWKTNGTVEGTVPTDAPTLRDPGYFAFDDGVHGRELWKTDGTEAGTFLVKDINPGADDGVVPGAEMVLIGETLFFPANDEVHGLELWKSDGTAAGTVMVRDIYAAEGFSSDPRVFADLNGALMFFANSGQSSTELWRSDGTEAGTVLVQDLRLIAPTGGLFLRPVVSNSLLFFVAAGPGAGFDLWRTDGTANGTLFLKDLHGFFTPPPELLDVEGTLFFTFQDIFPIDDGFELRGTLWTSDGSVEGTQLVKAFDPAPDTFTPVSQLTNYLGTLHFLAQAPTGHRELWKSDGTEGGAVRVGGLPAPATSVNSILGSYAGSLFLDVQEGVDYLSPHHIARMVGTTEATIVDDEAFIGRIEPFIGVGSNVYVVGTTEEFGRELWALPLQPAISASGVVDAAGYLPTLAPGGLASLFGVELAGSTAAATSFPLPTILAGAKIKVNGIDAPLLFVSPTQINFQVPYGTPTGAGVSVVAWLNGQQSLSQPTAVAEFAPAMFVNPNTGAPIIQRHTDGALITAQNPAKPGDTLVLYVTGVGGLDNPPVTGEAATDSPLATATTTPTVLVGGVEATVLFAGLAPDFAGLGQINIQLPGTLPVGSPLPLTIHFGESVSPTLQLPF